MLNEGVWGLSSLKNYILSLCYFCIFVRNQQAIIHIHMKRTWLVCLFILQMAWLMGQDRSEQMVSWMTGSFSSEEQSKSDTAYFDIRLLEIVGFWPEKKKGKPGYMWSRQWLRKRIDRQRVYRVRRNRRECL